MDTDDIAFDALAASQELREAGAEDRQAEAIAAAMRRAAAAGRGGLATKADTDALRAHVDASVASLRSGIDARFAACEARIYRALRIQGAGVIAVMAGLVSIAATLGMFG